MFQLTREESDYIRTHFPTDRPTPHITITSKEKSKGKRKKRYVEETPLVKRLLREFRNKELSNIGK